MTNTSPRWAQYELQFALSDGLFHPQKRQAHSPSFTLMRHLDLFFPVRYQKRTYPRGIRIHLAIPDTLDTYAETILLSLLYLAHQQGMSVNPLHWSLQTPLLLQPQNEALNASIGYVETTRYQLLKTAGFGHGTREYHQLTRTLNLLSMITVQYENYPQGWQGSDWLFKYHLNIHTEHLVAQFNWRLAGAVFGDYLRAYINLDEQNTRAFPFLGRRPGGGPAGAPGMVPRVCGPWRWAYGILGRERLFVGVRCYAERIPVSSLS